MTDYKGWDVHAYTDLINLQIDRYLKYNRVIKHAEVRDLLHEIDAYYKDAMVTNVIHKFKSRCHHIHDTDNYGYNDPDIHINVMLILDITWKMVKSKNDTSMYDLFKEIMIDIANHCIQGDSHRLIMLLTAMENDCHPDGDNNLKK